MRHNSGFEKKCRTQGKQRGLWSYGVYLSVCLAVWLWGIGVGQIGCGAQTADPLVGPNQFPQFRNLSGLAGSGFGVDPDGRISRGGPTAFSTPVAHTLGRLHVRTAGGVASFSSWPQFNSNNTNNSYYAMLGVTVGPFNIAGTIFAKSNDFDQVFNAQLQYIPPRGSKWVFSAGVQDIQGRGGSAGENIPTDGSTSASLFYVATYRLDTPRRPVYLTAGWGTRRFARLFYSASYQVLEPLRVWAEQDGYGINYGVTYAVPVGHGRRAPELTGSIGMQKGRYFLLGAGITF